MTRLGTASTKTRYEVRGSARKIRPQKGSGKARLGDKKSPMLRGGGVAHGPKPRDFSTGLQKKVYDLAWRTALSYRFRKGELLIVDSAIEIESPSTRLLQHIFDLHDRERGRGRSLLVTLEERPMLEHALDKMGRERQSLTWQEVDVKDLLELSRIIIERDALRNILLAHQEDLTHTSVTPWHKSFVNSSPPQDLESMMGWSEFRTLMQAPPSERDAIRPDAYESVAYGRWTRAETLPEGPEKLSLTISAYNLLAEAKDLRRERLPTTEPLEYEYGKKIDEASKLSDASLKHEADEVELAAKEAMLRMWDIIHQSTLLLAQAAEHRAEAFRWQGLEDEAEEEYSKARDTRTDVLAAEYELYKAKRQVAEQRSQVLINKDDMEGADKAQVEAQQAAEEEGKAQAEMAAPTEVSEEPYDDEVLEVERKGEEKEQAMKVSEGLEEMGKDRQERK